LRLIWICCPLSYKTIQSAKWLRVLLRNMLSLYSALCPFLTIGMTVCSKTLAVTLKKQYYTTLKQVFRLLVSAMLNPLAPNGQWPRSKSFKKPQTVYRSLGEFCSLLFGQLQWNAMHLDSLRSDFHSRARINPLLLRTPTQTPIYVSPLLVTAYYSQLTIKILTRLLTLSLALWFTVG
jgi:hypothetical protein